MKLKKIAALALAGVMAVSMLAGCNFGSNSSIKASAVIAALSESNKVAFKTDSKLQAAADEAAKRANEDADTELNADLVYEVDEEIENSMSYPSLPEVITDEGTPGSANTEKLAQTTGVFVVKSELFGASDEAIIKDLVSKIEAQGITATSGLTVTSLPAESKEYTDSNINETYKFTFKYTGKMAVTSTTNENGQVTYYAVFSVTRTPTRVAVDK